MELHIGSTSTEHEAIRSTCAQARAVVERTTIGGRPKSLYRQDVAELRATKGGGGIARVDLLEQIVAEAPVMVANVATLAGGVADCFEVASMSRDGELNTPATSVVLRSELEFAAQLCWLLEPAISAATRCRRYLAWRFADLASQRGLLVSFRDVAAAGARVRELEKSESDLMEEVTRAGWSARPTAIVSGSLQSAALLQIGTETGARPKAEEVPQISTLVSAMSLPVSMYPLLCAAAHGPRWAQWYGVEYTGPQADDGRVPIAVPGFGLSPEQLIALACRGVQRPVRLLAEWHGDPADNLNKLVHRIYRKAGLAT